MAHLKESELSYYRTNVGVTTGNLESLRARFVREALSLSNYAINDYGGELWNRWLTNEGATGDTVRDKWMNYLGGLGYTGTFEERIKDFFEGDITLPVSYYGSINAINKWITIVNNSETTTQMIPMLGDSQETSPGGQGDIYLPRLNYNLAVLNGGQIGKIYSNYLSSYGGGSPYAKFCIRMGVPYTAPFAELTAAEIPPNAAPIRVGTPSFRGAVVLFQQNALDTNPETQIPVGADLYGADQSFYIDVWAQPYSGSETVTVYHQQRDENTVNAFDTVVNQETSGSSLDGAGNIVKMTFGPWTNDNFANEPYNQIMIGTASSQTDSTTCPEVVSYQLRRASDPGGIQFIPVGEGGYVTTDFLANHGSCGDYLVNAQDAAPCVAIHYGTNDIYGSSLSGSTVRTNMETLISNLRGASFYNDSSKLIVIFTEMPRINGTSGQDTEADNLVTELLDLADNDDNVLIINTRQMCEDSGFTRDTGATYLSDSVHPNGIGSRLVASLESNAMYQIRTEYSSFDSDALDYFARVHVAGGTLDDADRTAINTFVEGLKSDGIWDDINYCGILKGSSTLDGALIPLKGSTTVTNNNFVSGDYDPAVGLDGDASTKYLDSGVLTNQIGTDDDHHLAVYMISNDPGNTYTIAGGDQTGNNALIFSSGAFSRNLNSGTATTAHAANALNVMNRISASEWEFWADGSETTVADSSLGVLNTEEVFIFARNNAGTPNSFFGGVLGYWSLGNGLSSAQNTAYNTRVKALMAALT